MEEFEVEIRKIFLEEAKQLLEDVEECFFRLEKEPENADVVERIFRLAHSLKGSSGGVGYQDIMEFTHHFENVLVRLEKRDGVCCARGERPESCSFISNIEAFSALLVEKRRNATTVGEPVDVSKIALHCDYNQAFKGPSQGIGPSGTMRGVDERKKVTMGGVGRGAKVTDRFVIAFHNQEVFGHNEGRSFRKCALQFARAFGALGREAVPAVSHFFKKSGSTLRASESFGEVRARTLHSGNEQGASCLQGIVKVGKDLRLGVVF